MNNVQIRLENLAKVKKMGLPINQNLPHIDDFKTHKTKYAVVDRALCIYALLAMSFGLDLEKGKEWLSQNNLISSLTDMEQLMLSNNDLLTYQVKVEALMCLAWCLNLFEKISHVHLCDNKLSSLFPKITLNETINGFRQSAILRSHEELLKEADLIYCIHWGMVENSIMGKENKIPLYVIEERRRAIDWILSNDLW